MNRQVADERVGKIIDIFLSHNALTIVMKDKYLNVYLNKGVVHMYSSSGRHAEKQTTDFHGEVKKKICGIPYLEALQNLCNCVYQRFSYHQIIL